MEPNYYNICEYGTKLIQYEIYPPDGYVGDKGKPWNDIHTFTASIHKFAGKLYEIRHTWEGYSPLARCLNNEIFEYSGESNFRVNDVRVHDGMGFSRWIRYLLEAEAVNSQREDVGVSQGRNLL